MPDLVLQFSAGDEHLDSLSETYNGLINGGNSEDLLNTIASLTTSNNSQLRQELADYSPYLTEEVIKAVLDYPSSVYPYTWQYDLVIDNIDVVKNYGFIDYLSTKSDPLPSAMIQGIETYAASGVITDKQYLESDLSYWSTERDEAANYIIAYYKYLSIVDMDSVRHWINLKSDPLAKARIIDTYLEEEKFVDAQSEIDLLNDDISNYPTHLQAELTDIVSLKSFLVAVFSDSVGKIANLSGSDLSYLENMASNGHGLAGYQAQNILCFFYGNCWNNTTDIPVQSKSQVVTSQDSKIDLTQDIKLYPNPAQNYVAIELPLMKGLIQIQTYDINGKLVLDTQTQKPIYIWDTGHQPNGTYVVHVILGDGKTKIEKMSIQH